MALAHPAGLRAIALDALAVVAAFAVSSAVHTYYARATRMGATDHPPELDYT